MAFKGPKLLSVMAAMALVPAATQSVATPAAAPIAAHLADDTGVTPFANAAPPAMLVQDESTAPQSSAQSATELGIDTMMQMLRDEGIDIDARMQNARARCRHQVTAEASDMNPDEIEQGVEDCAVVEENVIYARAINEMNANRVDNFNTSMAQHNAQVAEADRKKREYDRELEQHAAKVAQREAQQAQYEREIAAHEAQLAGKSPEPAQSPPEQLAKAETPTRPVPSPEIAGPAETAQAPAIAQSSTPTSSQLPSQNAGLSRSTGASRTKAPTQGRVLTQTIGPDQQDNIELAIMEASGPRIALIIGNEDYTGAMGSLANPVNDAVLIGATLRSVGFDVEILTNASQREMKEAVRRLGDRLLEAGENSTGLFYYAGHGVQSGGNNFLIPVGAAIDAESDLELEAVHADGILAQMEEAYISTRIVILDACRNMPLRRRTRNGERGLARMETPNGSFVAYSTSPGSTAADGGGIHSPFAEALATQMVVPDRPIEVTFREVRRQVVELTSGDQVPWDSSSLLDTFNFVTTR